MQEIVYRDSYRLVDDAEQPSSTLSGATQTIMSTPRIMAKKDVKGRDIFPLKISA